MTNAEIGERLRLIRMYRGWSQQKLGVAIYGDQSKISNIEHGYTTATLGDVGAMALLLFFSLDILMRSGPFDLFACLLPMP